MITLDSDWIAQNPLPSPDEGTDKNERGRVLAVGGSTTVPAALLLTGEAAFRSGAGKVQLATVASAAIAIGARFPEAAVHALDINEAGELAESSGIQIARLMQQSDALILGPGTGPEVDGVAILRCVARSDADLPMLIDAALLHALPDAVSDLADYGGAKILTPHPGEMATLMGCTPEDMCCELAEAAASRFGATVVLKSSETWIATPDQPSLHYRDGSPGLATGGSGDVLAGIIGGLLARGIPIHRAAAWGVWCHGEAGRKLANETGTLGFLAREIVPLIPRLLQYR